jgi:hypothetical protein
MPPSMTRIVDFATLCKNLKLIFTRGPEIAVFEPMLRVTWRVGVELQFQVPFKLSFLPIPVGQDEEQVRD